MTGSSRDELAERGGLLLILGLSRCARRPRPRLGKSEGAVMTSSSQRRRRLRSSNRGKCPVHGHRHLTLAVPQLGSLKNRVGPVTESVAGPRALRRRKLRPSPVTFCRKIIKW